MPFDFTTPKGLEITPSDKNIHKNGEKSEKRKIRERRKKKTFFSFLYRPLWRSLERKPLSRVRFKTAFINPDIRTYIQWNTDFSNLRHFRTNPLPRLLELKVASLFSVNQCILTPNFSTTRTWLLKPISDPFAKVSNIGISLYNLHCQFESFHLLT